MSRTIDERVVSMQFDNKHFENNVQTTLGTLDKLKKALKLDGAKKGLQDVGTAAKKCDLAPIGDSAQKVGLKFNALYTMADQAFRNMYNSAEAYAKKIVSAFTIDPVKAGFSEYETQINAVQTILANTQSKGTTLDDVNAALDTLNQYADKTIYNFTEMTRNIGTFTAAGVDLDTATNAIQGIANLAAVSGSTSQQASTAMYQLSQALSSGTVKLMDWNSVVNAGMGGQVFQDALKETARVHGVAIDDMIEKQGSFRETLSDGWLTSEILTETLQKFTLTTEGLTQEQIEANKQMLKSKGYTDEQIESIFELGKTATDAATKVKTFTQLFDTLKEAAQSGWTQSFEILVGDFEEAKELWTSVSNTIGEIIGKRAEKRNTLLEGALGSNWDRMEKQITDAGGSVDDFEAKIRESMTNAGIDVDKLLEKFDGSFEKAFKEGGADVKYLEDALNHMNETVEGVDLSKVTVGLKDYSRGEDVKQLQTALTKLGYELPKWGIDGIFHTETKRAVSEFQKAQGLKITGIVDEATLKALKEATSETKSLNLNVKDIIDGVTELGGRERLLNSFKNIFEAMKKPIVAIAGAWHNVVGEMSPETLYNAIAGFESFTQKLILSDESADQLARGFKGLFAIVKTLGSIVGGGLKLAFTLFNKVLEGFDMNLLEAFGYVGDLLLKFEQWISDNNYIAKGIEWLADKIVAGVKAVREWINEFFKLPKVQKFFNKFKDGWTDFTQNFTTYVSDAWTAIKGFFKTIYESDKVQAFLTRLKDGCSNVFGNIKERLSGLTDAFKEFFKNLGSGNGSFKESFATFKDSIVEYFSNIDYKAIAKTILSKIGNFIKTLVVNIVDIGKAVFGAIGTFLKNAWGAFEGIGKFIKENIGSILALASIALLLSTLRKIKMAVELISGPIEAIQEALTGLTAAAKRAATAALIKNLGISIGIIAASIAVLAQIPRGDLWNAVGAVGAIGVILGGLTFFMAKTVKNLNTKDTAVLSAYLLSIGGAMILMALTAKIMGSLRGDQWLKGVGAVVIFIGMMTVIAKAVNKIGSDVSKFGAMMIKLSASLIVLAIAMKMFAKMDGDVITKGGGVIIGFLTVMTFMMKSTSKVGANAGAFGKMMLSISAGLILMAYAVKILGKMDPKELAQGGLAIGALMLIIGLMTKVTAIGKDQKSGAYSLGKMMSGIGTALLLMSTSILMLGKMKLETLIQGGVAVGVLMGVVTLIAEIVGSIPNVSKNISKFGTMMIGFGAALLLISGSVVLLGLLDEDKLRRGVTSVTVIGLIMTALVAVSKNLNGVKTGPLIGISIALGVLAASVVVLSMLNKEKLATATAAMSALVLSLSALMKSMSGMQGMTAKSLIFIGAAALVVAGIGFLMKHLTSKIQDPDGALKIAIGVSAVVLAISATLSVISKVARTASGISGKGIGVAIGLLGVVAVAVGGLAALAIWQMPNIAKQFSSFMTELQGFITGAKNIDQDTLAAIKTLAEVMSIMGGASIKFGISKLFGIDALTDFKEFIVAAVPVVQQMAVEISNSDVAIDSEKVGVIVTAIKNLAEAAGNVPSLVAGGGLGYGKGIFGAAGGVMIPQLKKFTEFVKESVPVVKDMAIAVSAEGVNINVNAVNAIVGAVGTLAQAASSAPSIDVEVAATKMGGYASVNVPLLGSFSEFIKSVSGTLKDFGSNLNNITVDAETVNSICTGVSTLATAAKEAPGITGALGFGKAKGFWGLMGGIEIPLLGQFKTFISNVATEMTGFMTGIKKANITKEDAVVIESICESVEILAGAAKEAPGIDVALGIVVKKGTFALGTKLKIPLGNFKTFITDTSTAMSGFMTNIKAVNLTKADGEVIKGVCDSIEVLAEASSNASGLDITTILAGGAWGGALGVRLLIPRINKFKTFVSETSTAMSTFMTGIKKANITKEDGEVISGICSSVDILAGASKEAAAIDVSAIVAGGAWGGAVGTRVVVPMLKKFKTFVVDASNAMSSFMENIEDAGIDTGDIDTIVGVCTAVESLATASSNVPGVDVSLAAAWCGPAIAAGTRVLVPQLGKFKKFVEETVTALDGFMTNIHDAGITEEDVAVLKSICSCVEQLALAAKDVPGQEYAAYLTPFGLGTKIKSTDFDGFLKWLVGDESNKGMTQVLKEFKDSALVLEWDDKVYKKISEIGTIITNLSEASKSIPTRENWESWYSTAVTAADFGPFNEWVAGLGDVIDQMDSDMSITDPQALLAASEAIKNIGKAVDGMWDSLGTFKVSSDEPKTAIQMLEKLILGDSDNNGLLDVIKTIQEELPKYEIDTSIMSTTAKAFHNLADTVVLIGGIPWAEVNIPLFKEAMKDSAEAINSFTTTVTSPETVEGTCNSISDIVGLFSSMRDIVYENVYDFNDALTKFGDSTAVSGFVTAFTNENLGTARTNFKNIVDDMVTLVTKGVSEDTATGLVTALSTLGDSGVDEFVSAFSTANEDNSITTAVEGMVTTAASAAGSKSMISKFEGVGKNLAAGLQTGISSKVQSIADAAAALVRAAITAAEEEGGIESPSKVFRQIGYYLDEGLALGIDGMSHVVARSAVNVADTAIEGTKSVISRLASAIDSDIDTQPTIRPVLDLSDISSGASAINGMLGMRPSVRTLANVGYLSASVTNRQNGSNSDVISAIEKLGSKLGQTGPTYQFGDVSYNDDSAINNAMGQLVRAIRVERRK